MHDDHAVACRVPNPLAWYRDLDGRLAFDALVTVWHVDPEDGACPWPAGRWHVRHWKVTADAVRDLKRWLWSRCAKCGGRFAWGEAPVGRQWDGAGPRWFRGERGVRHWGCTDAPDGAWEA